MNAAVRRAIDLFRRFHEREPREKGDIVLIDQERETGLYIGEIVAVIYKTPGESVPYKHDFAAKHRPLLFVSSDGAQAYIIQGGYRFTARGFVG